MSDNKKNNGDLTQSQDQESHRLNELFQTLASIPVESLAKLPIEVAQAIEEAKQEHVGDLAKANAELAEKQNAITGALSALSDERAALATERAQIEAQRDAVAAERSALEVERSTLLPTIQKLIQANEQAAEREAKRDSVIDLWGQSLTRIEETATSNAETLGRVGSAMNAGFELMGMNHADSHKLAQEISGSISSLHGKHDNLSIELRNGLAEISSINNGVDKIGEMMNRMLDFVTNIKEVVDKNNKSLCNIEKNVVFIKEKNLEITSLFYDRLMGEFKKFSAIPDKVDEQVKILARLVIGLRSEGDSFIKKGRAFVTTFETRMGDISASVEAFRDLYNSHVSRLDTELGKQMGLINIRLDDEVVKITEKMNEAMKKSEMHTMLAQVHSYIEQLDHAQSSMVELLRAIQSEEVNLSGEIKAAGHALVENMSINARAISSTFNEIGKNIDDTKSETHDATATIKRLSGDIERLKSQLNQVAGAVESLMNFQAQGAITVAKEYTKAMDQRFAVNEERIGERFEQLKNEISSASTEGLVKFLGGDTNE